MTKLTRFGVSMEDELLKDFDQFIDNKGYANRSEALRDLVRRELEQEQLSNPNTKAIGTLTITYNHHANDLTDKLNDIQHDYFDTIITTTHVHVDAHNCLEVLLLRGKIKEIQAIADRLCSVKNITSGKLTLTQVQ